MGKEIKGFSKLSKQAKIEWVAQNFFENPEAFIEETQSFWHADEKVQKLLDEFSENTLTNYNIPLGVAPNFLINNKLYCIPLAIEESSVVAAASKAAKFWRDRGGFKAEVLDMEKIGQVHFLWKGTDKSKLDRFFEFVKPKLISSTTSITRNMEGRGGGIRGIELVDMTSELEHYYQLKGTFDTVDSMGANFINSILEQFASTLEEEAAAYEGFVENEKEVEIIMSILSNYTPNCIVRVSVECKVSELKGVVPDMSGEEFVRKFINGVRIAEVDPYRATTHNKGIFNGVDAVIIATGNDFRAVEACGHVYASRKGRYSSLSKVKVEGGVFKYWLDIPLALGTVGGLTTLHPMVKLALEMLGKPRAKELMLIAATVGLANNFGAVKSLVTDGIQKGHMKMHLLNILNTFQATEDEVRRAVEYFKTNVVSHSSVRDYLQTIRTPELQ